MPDIKACYHCGGLTQLRIAGPFEWVDCTGCGAQGPMCRLGEAIAAWNLVAEAIEALRRCRTYEVSAKDTWIGTADAAYRDLDAAADALLAARPEK